MTTSAQVHLALAVLKSIPPPPDNGDSTSMADAVLGTLYRNAADLLRTTLFAPDWSGASESCAPFGSIAEESAATIQNLQAALSVRDEMLNVLESACRIALAVPPSAPSMVLREAQAEIQTALEAVGALAAGVPAAITTPPVPSAGAGTPP